MTYASNRWPAFDHGAALRVPPPGDHASWRTLYAWLGDAYIVAAVDGLQILTPAGPVAARPKAASSVVDARATLGFFHKARTGAESQIEVWPLARRRSPPEREAL